MRIVDSQIHIWQNALPPNPYHRQIISYSHDGTLYANAYRRYSPERCTWLAARLGDFGVGEEHYEA